MLCKTLSAQGFTVIIATIAMFDKIYAWNRQNLKNYLDIYLKVPLDELYMRDNKKIYQRYKDSLAGIDAVKFFAQDLDHTTPWFIDVLVEQRDELMAYLERHQVGSRVMFPPINKQPAYILAGEHQVSNLIGAKGLWLPSAAQLTDSTVDYICDVIRRFYD